MVSKSRKFVFLTLGVCLLTEIAFAAKITSDYDKTADFSSYKTYAWGTNLEPTRGAVAAAFLVIMIDSEMRTRGMQTTDVEHADLIIRYQAATDMDMNFSSNDPTYALVGGVPVPGTSFWSSGFSGASSGRYIQKGALVIDVFDRAQHRLIWSAKATDTMKQGSTAKLIDQVGRILQQMFQKYPGKSPSPRQS